MNVYLSNPQQPDAPQAGQPTVDAAARAFLGEIEQALAEAQKPAPTIPTSYEDPTPVPTIGAAPPVPQPGIPPMSQRSTEIGRLIMFSSLATVPPGLIAIGVMVASEHANPTVIGMICGAPAALAVPILALARLFRGAKEVVQAAPAEQHVHVHGNVYEDNRSYEIESKGMWVKNNNQMSR